MSFISAVYNLLRIYKGVRRISKLLINETAQLLEQIGHTELVSAINCLNDAKYSNDWEREFSRAITMLRLSLDKLNDKNALKFQVALLLAICYKMLGDNALCNKYRLQSQMLFGTWIYRNRPYGNWPMRFGYVKIRSANRDRYNDFKNQVESFGIQWRGISFFYTLMINNPILFNEEVAAGCENAIADFNKLVTELFENNIAVDD